MASKISITIAANNQASGPIGQVQRSLANLQSQVKKGGLNTLGGSIAKGFATNGGALSEIASFVGKAGVIGGVTALTVKIAQLESQWASSVRSMSNLAVRSGLSTPTAFGVQYAGRLAGLSPEQANAGIEQVRQTYSDALNNRNPEALKRFQAAGISTNPERLDSIEDVLTKLASYAQVLREQGKYGGAQNFLNAAGAGSLVDFLNRGPGQVASDLASAKAYIPDAVDIQRAKEYADASARLGITYDRLKTTVLSGVEPALNGLLSGVQFLLDAASGRARPGAQPNGSDSASQRIWDAAEMFGNGLRGRGAVTMAQLNEQSAVGNGAKLEQARSMVEWYMGHGLSREQAIGMTANAFRESSFDERAENDSGHIGLFQWGRDRQKLYEKTFGRPLANATPEEQMGYSLWELRHSEAKAGDALLASGDAATAAARVSSLYERPGDPNEDRLRAGIARDLDGRLQSGTDEQGRVRVEIVHRNPPPGTSTSVSSSPNVDTQLKTDRQPASVGDQYAYSPGNF